MIKDTTLAISSMIKKVEEKIFFNKRPFFCVVKIAEMNLD
jgi:hypothetical protein